jgi:[ribosomal protein S5]-alanine N-acetyltransferase
VFIPLRETFALRIYQAEDETSLVDYADNPNVAAPLRRRFPSPYTLDDSRRWIALVLAQDPPTQLAITYEEKAVGGVGLDLGRADYEGTAELGFWLGEPLWGQGIMTEAIDAFLPWAFKTHRLQRVFAMVRDGNVASERVLEKAGFQMEGCLRKSIRDRHGNLRDQKVYAQLYQP